MASSAYCDRGALEPYVSGMASKNWHDWLHRETQASPGCHSAATLAGYWIKPRLSVRGCAYAVSADLQLARVVGPPKSE